MSLTFVVSSAAHLLLTPPSGWLTPIVLALPWTFFFLTSLLHSLAQDSSTVQETSSSNHENTPVSALSPAPAHYQNLCTTLMETAQVGIFQADAFGNLDYVNPFWGKMCALPSESALGGGWTRIVHPDQRGQALTYWKECAKSGESFEMDFKINPHDFRSMPFQEERWVHAVISKIKNSDEQNIGYVGVLVDITEKMAHQEFMAREITMVAQTAKMTSLVEMSSGVAHEINNPLSIIVGKVALIRRALQINNDLKTAYTHLDRIEETAYRIGKIVSSLRAFARDAAHDPMIEVSVKEIIQETLDLCTQRFLNHHVQINVGKLDDAIVLCRPSQISQVLMNVLSNAHDAIQFQENAWIHIQAVQKNDRVEIAITDSGAGIKPEIAQKMMQPFFTTKEIGKGPGLGLSIAKGMIEDHGGSLKLDSNSQNTKFIVELPIIVEKTLAS